jgi:hypothetical protein
VNACQAGTIGASAYLNITTITAVVTGATNASSAARHPPTSSAFRPVESTHARVRRASPEVSLLQTDGTTLEHTLSEQLKAYAPGEAMPIWWINAGPVCSVAKLAALNMRANDALVAIVLSVAALEAFINRASALAEERVTAAYPFATSMQASNSSQRSAPKLRKDMVRPRSARQPSGWGGPEPDSEFATLCGAGRVWRHADLSALPGVQRHP